MNKTYRNILQLYLHVAVLCYTVVCTDGQVAQTDAILDQRVLNPKRGTGKEVTRKAEPTAYGRTSTARTRRPSGPMGCAAFGKVQHDIERRPSAGQTSRLTLAPGCHGLPDRQSSRSSAALAHAALIDIAEVPGHHAGIFHGPRASLSGWPLA